MLPSFNQKTKHHVTFSSKHPQNGIGSCVLSGETRFQVAFTRNLKKKKNCEGKHKTKLRFDILKYNFKLHFNYCFFRKMQTESEVKVAFCSDIQNHIS